MKKINEMTNIEFVNHLMKNGPSIMTEAFIVDAIKQVAESVAANKEQLYEDEEKLIANGKSPIVSYKAWANNGVWIKEQFDFREKE